MALSHDPKRPFAALAVFVVEGCTVFRADRDEFDGAVFDFWSDEEVLILLCKSKTSLQVEFGGEFFAELLFQTGSDVDV